MNKNVFVGVDIGGTTVKLAFIDEIGTIQHKWEIKTAREEAGKYILRDVSESILTQAKELGFKKSQLLAVGVGAPGYIDVENGVIIEAVNLGWKNYPIQKELEDRLQLPAVIDNDANVAAAGEKWKGAGNGADNLLAITLGTGVGGGVIAGGEIVHGEIGMAGEIGHITSVKSGGASCNCGKTGCLETVASATGIARLAMESVHTKPQGYLKRILDEHGNVSAKDVFDGANQGDELSLSIVRDSTEHLGFAMANLANALNPEIIVIGGGVSRAGTLLVNYIRQSFDKYAIPLIAKSTTIKIATLGNDAGVIGAAWLAKQKSAH
ncbi:glucokinase [Salipaludibacillus neizhouensis]|uniref:Glucokinase n=1 Tax=Salipaludibacillus neizhouensis TaxID=885475 RepID=A0A3A9KLM1_9BACI|nr:ROK family glucokinase [Salipaludibacillus neizhouensis]RKL68735.1 glucokinase [Salipaludibacillus neizhouensis]